MRKNKLLLIAILVFLNSCGYQILNKTYNSNFEIISLDLIGDQNVNKHLKRNFSRFFKNDNAKRFFDIRIESQTTKKITSKDSAGNETSFSIQVNVKVDINENNKISKNLNFEKKINYNNLSSKFELKQYELLLIKDLSNLIFTDISSYLGTL